MPTQILFPAASPSGVPVAQPYYLVDIYGNPITSTNGQMTNLAQVNGNPVPTPAGTLAGNYSAAQIISLGLWNGGTQMNPLRGSDGVGAPDSMGLGSFVPAMASQYSGTNLASFPRLPFVTKELKAVAITAGTPVSVWTPAAGKKFHVLCYVISATVAAAILFEDTTGSGNEFWRTPTLLAATPFAPPLLTRGYLSNAANNALFLDATVTTNVSGILIGLEE